MDDTQENYDFTDLPLLDISVPNVTSELLEELQENGIDCYDSDRDPEIQPENLESSDTSEEECGNGDGGERSLPKRKKSRMVKISPDWARFKLKSVRNNGEGHTTKSGKVINRRNVDVIDRCPCKFKCTDTFSHDDRVKINTRYWNLCNYGDQKHYIDLNVKETPCIRKLIRPSKRLFTWTYNFNDNQVCKSFFLKTLNITDSVVVRCKKKARVNENVGEDLRGKCQVNRKRVDPNVIECIKKHIQSFPMVESHNCRKDTQKMYLQSDLNLAKMYDLFSELNPESTVKISTYRRVFKEYNLSFHKPKKDQCSTCTKYTVATVEEREKIQAKYDQHLANKKASRDAKNLDKEIAMKDPSLKVYTFDLQSVLPTPCGEVSNFYYVRKFATYNLTMYDLATAEGYCYMWHETQGARGADEIASIIYRHINQLPDTVKKVILYSDCCGGQNRNRYVRYGIIAI